MFLGHFFSSRISATPLGLCLLVMVVLSGCATPANHISLKNAKLPPLLPVRNFVANIDHSGNYQVSPDGKQLLWSGVSRLRPALFWRNLDGTGKTQVRRFKKNSPHGFWAADSKHILYHRDDTGREQAHVYAINSADGTVRDLTPLQGITAWVAKVPEADSSHLFIAHNGRDATVFDTYRVDLETATLTRIFTNTANISHQLIADDGTTLIRVLRKGKQRVIQLPDGDKWRDLRTYSRFENFYPFQIDKPGESVLAYSNLDRDRTALVSINVDSGKERIVYEHPTVDIGSVWGGPGSRPLAVTTQDGLPAVHYLDDNTRELFAELHNDQPAGLNLYSLSRDGQTGTVSRYDHTGATTYLINKGQLEKLSESSSIKHAKHWSQPQPFSIAARDGLNIQGYVTRPLHIKQATPTIVHVHGGPWARDYWEHNDQIQFLVNRGYTVLQVNYRGSTGYGRAHRDAAKGEFAGKMHTDLLDAVDWAVEQGYSDPDKIGIMGGSYGGYATLVGLAFSPERFACGVDIVGVSDLATLLEDAPPHWLPEIDFWYSFVGDPGNKKERAAMNERSPLYRADKVTKPLLVVHGVNDPRVSVDQSDRMVEALRKSGSPVTYIRVKDEGHGFGHWKNQLKLYRLTEDFFADCLGGRSSGFDFYELGSWAF